VVETVVKRFQPLQITDEMLVVDPFVPQRVTPNRLFAFAVAARCRGREHGVGSSARIAMTESLVGSAGGVEVRLSHLREAGRVDPVAYRDQGVTGAGPVARWVVGKR
jgi:hypothetical protein